MKESDRYIKIVEWSDEDGCFVGSCPGIIDACCHGDDEIEVYTELCQIVNEWIETNAVKLSRSMSGVEAILPASAPLSQRLILPGGA